MDESVRLWQEQFSSSGVPSVEGERIVALGREDNWWGPVGETGPCGPDTEMFYDTGTAPCGTQCRAGCGCGCGKYLEIWNDVFMEFSMQADGSCQRLPRPNVDTGLGMARMLAVLNGVESVYDIDVLKPLIDCLANLSTRDHASIAVSFRIVADHVTSACHIIADGVAPANTERGYVLRRLIRRSLVHARKLGVRERALWRPLFDQLRRLYVDDYPGIDEHADHILQILTGEEEQFGRTIETGLKQFHGLVEADAVKRDRTIDGRAAFELFATYGFPLEMTRELAGERGIGVDEEGFRAEFARHQELSRQGARERFAGGLADKSELAVRYHTTTHLLHAALRQVLGGHVEQRGSHITAERLRFDFSHPRKLEQEEKSRIEALVNWAIERDYSVHCAELSADEAREGGAIGLFKERYGDRVKVYAIGDFKPAPCAMRESLTFSKEICGGPHVERTGDLGRFRIVKEQSASGGVRRVRATLE
jgi:alanyl-tRNA synthetase